MYLVIENTPGYLPDVDEPAEFESYAEGVSYANELADELEEQGYECDRSWASSQNTYAIHCTTKDKIHDLGRNIEVIQDEETLDAPERASEPGIRDDNGNLIAGQS